VLRFELEFQHQKSAVVIIELDTCGTYCGTRVISSNLTRRQSGKMYFRLHITSIRNLLMTFPPLLLQCLFCYENNCDTERILFDCKFYVCVLKHVLQLLCFL